MKKLKYKGRAFKNKIITLVVLTLSVVGFLGYDKVMAYIKANTTKAPKIEYTQAGSINKEPAVQGPTQTNPENISQNVTLDSDVDLSGLDIHNLPADGKHYVELGASNFSTKELNQVSKDSPYQLQSVDALGRAVQADAYLNRKNYKGSKDRPRITVNPVGWHNEQLGRKKSLYNRSHLLAYAFMKANIDVKENLVTGLEEFNKSKTQGMQKFENEVELAVKRGKTIRYQVRAIYDDQELLPRGVLMRYKSLDDNSIDKTVFVYNVMDGVSVDYATGYRIK
jgi:hypothetical protein